MKIFNQKAKKNLGMSYIELIVVLAIFSIMTSIVLFNYRDFQSQVEVKSLATDIALKIVQAQKEAMSGKLPSAELQKYLEENNITNWRPAYGVYFHKEIPQAFIYFADLDSNKHYNADSGECDGNECIDKISINNKHYISGLYVSCSTGERSEVANLSVTFQRPDSKADIQFSPVVECPFSHVTISIPYSSSMASDIEIYPSGRIQFGNSSFSGSSQGSSGGAVPKGK